MSVIVSIFMFFVLCFHRFHVNSALKCSFDCLYHKKFLFLFTLVVRQKKDVSYSVPIVLLVINETEILPLNNHLFKKRDINIVDIT